MSDYHLSPLPSPRQSSGPLLVVIADGVGIAPEGPSNAVALANTPTLDALAAGPMSTTLKAHGVAVGLPTDDDMGNSEVGHNALGAGRIFAQGAKLVNAAIESGSIYTSTVWAAAMARVAEPVGGSGTLHVLGLHSDGNVHAHVDHLYNLLRRAAAEGVKNAVVHILLDGRDVDARSALLYIEATESVLAEINTGAEGANFRIGSGGGRMVITMDRYEADWSMVERGYHCHVNGKGRGFASAWDAVTTMYAESDLGDQDLAPFVIVDGDGVPVGRIGDGDSVIMSNFRGDRAIEISQAMEYSDFTAFDRGDHPDVYFAGMLQYDGDSKVPANYLVDPPAIDRTMSDYLCAEGVTSFAISETQKFGHVTYFWNGNRSGYVNADLETYVEIPSDVISFDQAPAMKAAEIADEAIRLLESGDCQFGRLNFANGDMVGHTGNLAATIEAMEALDTAVARLVEAIDSLGGILIYTADHGNADVMYKESNGVRSPVTSHTLNPVPFAIHDKTGNPNYSLESVPDAGLGNVAATVINLLGFGAPDFYEPSLVRFD